jgi:excisionase family DNA binding protein
MSLAPSVSSPVADSQLVGEVRFAFEGLARGLVSKLTSLVEEQLAGKKVSAKAMEKVVAANFPSLLEQEFIASLLTDKSAGHQRAVLVHVLSTAQVQALAGSDTRDESELTSEAAAKLLHVSRSHLNSLADSGALGEVRRTAGNHRRISRAALLEYKARSKERQAKGLDAMMEASRKLGLYEEELSAIPRKTRR